LEHKCTECGELIEKWSEDSFKKGVEQHYESRHKRSVTVVFIKGLSESDFERPEEMFKVVDKK